MYQPFGRAKIWLNATTSRFCLRVKTGYSKSDERKVLNNKSQIPRV